MKNHKREELALKYCIIGIIEDGCTVHIPLFYVLL
jgi:hypothetical protein